MHEWVAHLSSVLSLFRSTFLAPKAHQAHIIALGEAIDKLFDVVEYVLTEIDDTYRWRADLLPKPL